MLCPLRQDPDGFPIYNPCGKYAVRLYVLGATHDLRLIFGRMHE